jgi:hypothetical protein
MSFYQVVAECAHVSIDGPLGRTVQLLYKGAIVPAQAPQLQRLAELGFVAEVGKEETGGVNADGVPAGAFTTEVPEGVTSTPVEKTEEQKRADAESGAKAKTDREVADRRAAAKAKLPTDGSAPHANAGQSVWVEYLVARGSNYDDIATADKDDLVRLAKQQS